MNRLAPKRILLVGAVLTTNSMRHLRGRDRCHGTGNYYLEPCPMTCWARQPANGDLSSCTENRTHPLVGAVSTANNRHRHPRCRDRSHGTGERFLVPSCP